MKQSGLVLKNYLPIKHKISLLNWRGERLDAVASNPIEIERLRPGYTIAYNLVDSAHFNILKDIELVGIPKVINYENLQFLHLVIEICSLIIPEGQIVQEAVEVLNIVTNCDTGAWKSAQRRLLVCWLLSLAGFYPELMAKEYELVHKMGQINSVTASDFLEFKVSAETNLFLIKWITDFVSVNVPARFTAVFKTIYQD